MANKTIVQIAFNHTSLDFAAAVGHIPSVPNIFIEAGTPLIKREGIGVVRRMRAYWPHKIVADMKIVDGAAGEVAAAKVAGADYVTAVGSASVETLKLFVNECKKQGIGSVIDMINVVNPMKVLWHMNVIPDMVYIHRGRDEESAYGKIIQYKEIAKIKGKWDITVGAAGGIDKKELQSAIFNGADVVVVNVIKPGDPWKGLMLDEKFRANLEHFLEIAH
ncbi:MAG TPA: orotidine 5'-phosphate decarboxylase [bacterium]|nr:orotidine 5'-phosphate decarboxylase [bacterium]